MIKDFTSETEVRLSRLADFEGNYAEIVLSLIKITDPRYLLMHAMQTELIKFGPSMRTVKL